MTVRRSSLFSSRTMKSPKVLNTFKKEKARIAKLSEAALTERQREVAGATADDIRSVLRKHKQDECTGDDGGLLKAKVFNMYGLGEPPKKSWSKAGAVFMLEERQYDYNDEDVATKKLATDTLMKARKEQDEGSSDNGTVPVYNLTSNCLKLQIRRRRGGRNFCRSCRTWRTMSKLRRGRRRQPNEVRAVAKTGFGAWA